MVDLVFAKLWSNDRQGAPTGNLARYAEPVENVDGEGNVISTTYTFELVENAKFSDSTPVTADDVIFTFKVLCDPFYDGPSTLYTTPIAGLKEYRYDDENYAETISGLEAQAAAYEPSEEEIQAAAQEWADFNGMTKEEFLPGTGMYDAYVLPEIRTLHYQTLEQEYIASSLSSGGNQGPRDRGH